MNISIFAQPPSVVRHLQRVSTIIRGEQIAAYMLNARLNPTSGYEDDVCIYVKPYVKPEWDFKFEGKRAYVDICDGYASLHLLKRPENKDVGVIAFSDLDVETLTREIKNKVVLIPHHHINFERASKKREGVEKIGIIGSEDAFKLIPDEIVKGIAERKMRLVKCSTMYPRMTVVHFYQNIDVCLLWRPYTKELSNPFKIVNASAFGIPTIALDEPAFKEVEGCYLPVSSPQEFLDNLDTLRDSPLLYSDISEDCLQTSERYHISRISELYNQL